MHIPLRIKAWALFVFLFVCVALPGAARAEFIDTFNSRIDVRTDGTFVVEERITYVFDVDKHGIVRTIPLTHPDKASSFVRDRFIDIEIQSIALDESPVPFEVKETRKEIVLTIGDPEKTVFGKRTYTIVYTVRGGISYPQYGGAELYFNVTGNDSGVPIRTARAILSAETSMFESARACYQGGVAATKSCDQISDESNTITFVSHELSPYEGLTIAQSIDRSKIAYLALERVNEWWLWGGGSILWFLGLIWYVYSYRTAQQTGNSIIAQYEPFPGVKPMYTGLLFDGSLDPRDITAGIVQLASEGYLAIRKIDRKVFFFFDVDDYEITFTKSIEGIIDPFEKVLISLLSENPKVGDVVTLHDLKNNLEKQKENFTILSDLRHTLEQDLEDQGFFRVSIPTKYLVGGPIVIALAVIVGVPFVAEYLPRALPALFVVAGSAVILLFMYRRRTGKGFAALDHLKGFKEFLSVTDEERFAFHNAPEKSPEQFMAYLPYAIAFGVEEKWASVFKDISIPAPEWYEGSTGAAFAVTDLTTSLGSFSSALIASASPSSSGASGGGGFSGGGAGGGGVGSW